MLPRYADLDPETRTLIISLLPMAASEFVRLIGLAPALALFSQFGGTERRFAKKSTGAGARHFAEVAAVIGPENAHVLGGEYPCEEIYIPRCKQALTALRNREIVADFDEMTRTVSGRAACNQLARKHGLSNRSIEMIVNGKSGLQQPSHSQVHRNLP